MLLQRYKLIGAATNLVVIAESVMIVLLCVGDHATSRLGHVAGSIREEVSL